MPRFRFSIALALVCSMGACTGGSTDGGAPADGPPGSVDSTAAAPSAGVPDSLPVLDGVTTFAPVDEGAADASFARFREGLLRAIEGRDTAALLAVVAPDIRNTFGDDDGRDAFRRMWDLADRDSELWRVLARVLRHGGTFRTAGGDTLFMAPYVYAAWPAERDPFGHVATLTSDAVVRAAADSGAAALGVLPHRIVALGWPPSAEGASEAWTEVELADGRRAWIASEDVYSPVDYRAIFARRDGAWRLITLVAGD